MLAVESQSSRLQHGRAHGIRWLHASLEQASGSFLISNSLANIDHTRLVLAESEVCILPDASEFAEVMGEEALPVVPLPTLTTVV